MITKYLPEFKVLEVNDLVGLRSGHMISQIPANAAIATKTVGEQKFIENGIFVGLGADGTIENFDPAKHDTMFVHYTEELNTYIDELKYFAVPVEKEGSTYPRCIALYVNDAITTNNIANIDLEGATHAKVTNGVAELQTAADNNSAFIAKKSTLPTGEVAYELTYYKLPKVGA